LFVAVAVQNVLPIDITAVDIDKLVAFKQRHQDEFIAFQRHIDSLGEALGTAAHVVDASALQEHLQVLYERETRPLVNDLEHAMNSSGLKTAAGALTMKVDVTSLAGSALGTGLLATGAPAVIAGAGFAAALVPVIASGMRLKRQLKRDSPVSFLLSARRDLPPKSLIRRLLG
jgi:hypothetical protein